MLPKVVDSQIKYVVETASKPFQESIHYPAERFQRLSTTLLQMQQKTLFACSYPLPFHY